MGNGLALAIPYSFPPLPVEAVFSGNARSTPSGAVRHLRVLLVVRVAVRAADLACVDRYEADVSKIVLHEGHRVQMIGVQTGVVSTEMVQD